MTTLPPPNTFFSFIQSHTHFLVSIEGWHLHNHIIKLEPTTPLVSSPSLFLPVPLVSVQNNLIPGEDLSGGWERERDVWRGGGKEGKERRGGEGYTTQHPLWSSVTFSQVAPSSEMRVRRKQRVVVESCRSPLVLPSCVTADERSRDKVHHSWDEWKWQRAQKRREGRVESKNSVAKNNDRRREIYNRWTLDKIR